MKFFNWMQNKFSAGQGDKRANAVPAAYHKNEGSLKAECSDWPHGLLAIGTFGYKDHTAKQQFIQVDQTPETKTPLENVSSSPDFADFTAEEIQSLQKELTKLLRRKPASKTEEPVADQPLDRYPHCASSLEVDHTVSGRFSTYSDDKDEEDIDRTIRIILGRCKDFCEKKKKKAIGRKSFSFLVKKMFVCTSGFLAIPGFRDAFQESRMEKLLRRMLLTKIYPQNSSRASSTKKCLEGCRHTHKGGNEEGSNEKGLDGSRWDKTDSEFIVLEI